MTVNFLGKLNLLLFWIVTRLYIINFVKFSTKFHILTPVACRTNFVLYVTLLFANRLVHLLRLSGFIIFPHLRNIDQRVSPYLLRMPPFRRTQLVELFLTYVCADRFYLLRYPNVFSSLTGELLAIRKAVEVAAEKDFLRIVIYTDSINSTMVLRQSRSLNQLIHIVWVPSHVGVYFNERVDYMAKQATNIGTLAVTAYNYGEALRKISSTGSFFFSLHSTISIRPWYSGSNMSPRDFMIIKRLLSGHTYDGVYLHRIGKKDNFNCLNCDLIGTLEHVIFYCDKYRSIRDKHDIFNDYSNLSDLLNSHNIDVFDRLIYIYKRVALLTD
ncbi:hypothetical protein CVS40_6715 [Lucilia cuprina]|nr:hypothetical protein CVS40_6715 [Lucilia cuprina]